MYLSLSDALYRLPRLVCFQNDPDAAPPTELLNANHLDLSRLAYGSRFNSAL